MISPFLTLQALAPMTQPELKSLRSRKCLTLIWVSLRLGLSLSLKAATLTLHLASTMTVSDSTLALKVSKLEKRGIHQSENPLALALMTRLLPTDSPNKRLLISISVNLLLDLTRLRKEET